MNKTAIPSPSFEGEPERIVSIESLVPQNGSSQEQKKLFKTLTQEFQLLDFKLGDEILVQKDAEVSQLTQQYFWLVCEGRLRLLAWDEYKQREVSTNLIFEGTTFGGDSFWYAPSLPYSVVAASPVKVARIPTNKLTQILENFPELKQKWRDSSQQNQRLIFFKTQTQLRFLASQRIKNLLLPYLVESTFRAGEYLKSQPNVSRSWLKQGKITDQNINIGDSWGYQESEQKNWSAQSDVIVYQLPQENWQTVSDLLPELMTAWSKQPEVEFSQSLLKKERTSAESLNTASAINVVSSNLYSASNSPDVVPNQPTESPVLVGGDDPASEIDYPKPARKFGLRKKFPFIEQQSSSDCGAACLAMISKYWGKSLNLNFLREIIGVGRSGSSLKSLARAAESIGYRSRPVRASFARIAEQKNPWIAHWQGDHYVVVYRIKKDSILIADPASGNTEVPHDYFLENWTGYALILEPTENLNLVPEQKPSLNRFFKLLWPYRSIGILVIVASFLIQILGLISPLFTQIILDQVVVNQSQSTLNILVIGLILFGVLGLGLTSIRNYLLSYLAIRLDLTMVGGFINHALNLPLKFFESRRVGDIVTRVQENQKIQQFLIQNVLLSWLDFLTGLVYLGLMLYYNWQLTGLILLLIPPIVLLTLAATPLLRKVSRERFNATANQNSSLVEMITGISTVKAVTAEKDLRWRWEDLLTKELNIRFKGQKLAINLGLLSGLINSIGGIALLWLGASLVIQGKLSIGQYVAFNMMKGHIISPVMTLVGLWDELQEVLISVERLNDVYESKSEELDRNSKLLMPELTGHVVFDNVSFRYDNEEDTNVLQNISFEVSPGQTVAIVGRSGSGKSTLVKLIQGLYHPISGQVSIDGHNLKHVVLKSLRSQMGVVPQDCFLFSGTILENITLYSSEFTIEQAIKAAKLAEAHSFIQSLPLGYNTKVGERGDNLSGGQRQRIAIARAFLGNPGIFVLDEATSSLDTESERRFQENLARLARQRTTFIIAHRLSTVKNADCIIVLDRGLIAEQGTHEELIAQQGIYYHLAKQQLSL